MYEQLRVVIAAVARHFLADEAGLCERLVLGAKLHLGNYESGVVAEELVDLERVAPVGRLHEPATLVYHSAAAKLEEVLRLIVGYLLFELVARESGTVAVTLDGEPGAVVAGRTRTVAVWQGMYPCLIRL